MKKKRRTHHINTRAPCKTVQHLWRTGPFTEDHTPPNGWGRVSHVVAHSLSYKLASSGERWYQPGQFQGVFAGAVTAQCNNLMGRQYDPVLVGLCAQVRALVNTTLIVGQVVCLMTRPQAVPNPFWTTGAGRDGADAYA